jgi:hypothetical protein
MWQDALVSSIVFLDLIGLGAASLCMTVRDLNIDGCDWDISTVDRLTAVLKRMV